MTDLISIIRAEVREMEREAAEAAIYEAKATREFEARNARTIGERLPRVIGSAIFAGGLAWGLIALFGVTAFLVVVAAFAGTALLRDG